MKKNKLVRLSVGIPKGDYKAIKIKAISEYIPIAGVVRWFIKIGLGKVKK